MVLRVFATADERGAQGAGLRALSATGFADEVTGNRTGMNHRLAYAVVAAAALALPACSADSRSSIETDVKTAASDVGNAIDEATKDAAEAAARNIATQQGEEQFKHVGQELAGDLACEATVQGGVSSIDIDCTGTTKAGGAAALTGTTKELPGASVVTLDGQFTGTVDGQEVFTTERLGG
jgi:hypothetical protein